MLPILQRFEGLFVGQGGFINIIYKIYPIVQRRQQDAAHFEHPAAFLPYVKDILYITIGHRMEDEVKGSIGERKRFRLATVIRVEKIRG